MNTLTTEFGPAGTFIAGQTIEVQYLIAAAPEPGTLGLIGVGVTLLLASRRGGGGNVGYRS
jgi:hypothetical protein